MHFPRLVLALIALTFAGRITAATPTDAPQFAHEKSDLKADPAVRFGTLKNGLRYALMANKEPRERASLRLVVMAGAFHETEAQRGLAHFLEHMAFNGSTHYAPGTMVELFQRLGMSFGGDTNAYTSFDHTAYMLELPDTKPATLDEGLQVFSDYAGGLLLQTTEIDKERGIILSEKRDRDSVEFRQMLAEFRFLLGGTLLPDRMPIGTTEVIEKADRARFLDFYNTWYRPERIAIVAIGDFDPAQLETKITTAFSGLAARSPARPSPDLGKIESFEGVRVTYHHEPEAGATAVSIQTIAPLPDEPDTRAQRIADFPREVAFAMLDRRLDILSKKEGAPFSASSASAHDGFNLFRNAGIELTCKPEQWSAALSVAENELRRAIEYGFQPAELQEVTANFLNQLEQADKTAASRRSNQLASALTQALVNGHVFTTPSDDLALYRPALAELTTESCHAALRAAFTRPGLFVSVMGNAKIPGDASAAIRTAYDQAHVSKISAPEKIADAHFAYTDFGPLGTITSRQHIDDLDLDLITFSNGVRLNLKKTDFEIGKIRLNIRVGGGRLTEPKSQPGLAFFTDSILLPGGLGRHSIDELQRVLAGKTVGLGFRVGGDAFVFNTATNRDDLLLQLQLASAYLTDSAFRPEALRTASKHFEQMYTRLAHIPDGPLQLDVPRRMASGDARFGLPARHDLDARTLDEARAWLTPQFAHGPIEIALVGDLNIDDAIAAVARTLAALPVREAKPSYEAERIVTMPPPFTQNFTIPTEIPKGYAAVYWPTTDSRDIRITRRLHVLTEILNDRMRIKIREELGDAYSPSASSGPSDTFRNYGLITALVSVDPAKAQLMITTLLGLADELAKNGVTEDELARARKPILTAIHEASRTNPYWLGNVLSSAQENPQRLDWRRSIETDFPAITKAELDALARQYLPAARAFRVTSLPAPKPTAPPKSTTPDDF